MTPNTYLGGGGSERPSLDCFRGFMSGDRLDSGYSRYSDRRDDSRSRFSRRDSRSSTRRSYR